MSDLTAVVSQSHRLHCALQVTCARYIPPFVTVACFCVQRVSRKPDQQVWINCVFSKRMQECFGTPVAYSLTLKMVQQPTTSQHRCAKVRHVSLSPVLVSQYWQDV